MLKDHLNKIRKGIEDKKLNAAERDILRKEYEHQLNNREVHRMRTWPYGVGVNIKYLAGVVPSIFAATESVRSWMHLP